MRIVVNDVAAERGGALTILYEFYDCVVQYGKEHEWIFLLSKPYLEEKEHIKIKVYEKTKKSIWNRLVYDYFEGRKLEKELKPDLFLSMQNIVFWGVKTKQVVYVHQPIPFQKTKKYSFYKKEERKFWIYQNIIGRLIKKSIKRAKCAIVQTKWMYDAILELYQNKDVMILQPHLGELVLNEKLNWDYQKFFVPISDLSYKNSDCVYQANNYIKDSDYQIYMTLVGDSKQKNIFNIGYVNREKMCEMYQTCTMIFPSYIESFGLPLAEAREIGTLILASDCPFSREILEGYENVYYFDPFKPKELAELMKLVLKKKIKLKKINENKDNNGNSWQLLMEKIIFLGNNE